MSFSLRIAVAFSVLLIAAFVPLSLHANQHQNCEKILLESLSIPELKEFFGQRITAEIYTLLEKASRKEVSLTDLVTVRFRLSRGRANDLSSSLPSRPNIPLRTMLRAAELAPLEEAEIYDYRTKSYSPDYFEEEITLEASGELKSLLTFLEIYKQRSKLFGWTPELDWLNHVSLSLK